MKRVILQIKKWKLVFRLMFIFAVMVYLPLWFISFNLQKGYVSPDKALPVLGSDSFEYKTLADNILNHHFFSLDLVSFEYFRTPGYPYFIAVLKFFGGYFFVTLVQIILTFATAYLIYKIVERFWGEKWALFSCGLFLIEPSVILHSLVLLSDIPFVFIITMILYLLIDYGDGRAKYFIVGILVGLSVLFRPISIFIPILIFIKILFDYKKNIKTIFEYFFCFLVGFSLLLLPWAIRNNYSSGKFIVSTISSYNLFYYNATMFVSQKTGDSEEVVRQSLSKKYDLQSLDWRSPEAGKKLEKASLDIIGGDFISYVFFHLYKSSSFLFGSSLKMLNHVFCAFYDMPDSISITKKILFTLERILWLVLWCLALLSVFVRDNRKVYIYCLVIIFYFIFLTGPVAYARYRIPALPFLFITVPAGINVAFYFFKLKLKRYA